MSAAQPVRDRWMAFMAERGFTGHALAADAVRAGMDFAAAEVQRERLATEASQGALTEASILDEKPTDDVIRLLELGRYQDALETLRKVRT